MFEKIFIFFQERKKWWQIPVLLIGLVIILVLFSPQKISSTPFIYMLY